MARHCITPARRGLLLALCAAVLPGRPDPAGARAWNPDATALARDYSIINDTRPNHDVRVVFWMTSPMMSDPRGKAVVDSYVILGVLSSHIGPSAAMSFDPVETLHPAAGDGTPLKLMTSDDIPPSVNGMVTTMTTALGQSMGPFGKGIHWFVFDAGSVNACKPGGLSVPFLGEIYTYKTPIPGCARQEAG
jgi:hypothetical protein